MIRKLLLFFCLGLTCIGARAQVAVSGKITDELGDPIAGVFILEKGTTNGIYSNLDGEYALVVSNGATVIFKMLGYKNVEKENPSGTFDLVMVEDAIQMDAVVITALGIPEASRQLGYSVQSVDGADVRNSGETNTIAGLGGKVAGVQVISSSGTPGGSAFIRIRGSRSLDGNNQPLLVVDGVPMDNGQYNGGNPDDGDNNLLDGVGQSNRGIDINPNDIETITVLKGPNASALYGIAAANGAIVITTKRGKATTGKAVTVTYNVSLGLDMVNRLPELQNKYAQGELMDANGWTYGDPDFDINTAHPTYLGPETGEPLSWGPSFDTLYFNGDQNYDYDNNGSIVGQSDPTKTSRVTPYDNLGTFFQTGQTWNNNLSFSGGTQAATYRLSIGQTSQTGVVPNSDFSRTSARFNGDAHLSKRLTSISSLSYTHSGGQRVQQGSNTSGLMLGLLRTPNSFDNSNGLEDPVNDPTAYMLADGSQRNFRGGGGYDNPYWAVNKTPFTDNVNRFFGSTGLSYDATKWLNIFYRVGTDTYSDDRTQVFDINSRTAPAGRIYRQSHNYRHMNSDLWITARKAFSPNLNGSLMLGNNLYDEHYSRIHTQGDGFIQAGFYNLSNATSVIGRQYNSNYRKAAVFADAKLAWKNMLYLNLTGRNEWSSTLPTTKNSFFYPSASVGFVFTELLGWTDKNKVLPYGKLRISYASVGQDAPVYALGNYYNSAFIGDGWTNGISFPMSGVAGFQSSDQLGSPNLLPEKTSSFEMGTDLRFFDGRIGLDFTYYKTTSTNQIFPVPIASSAGYLTMVMNSGEVQNTGIEMVLDATPIKKKNFRWDASLNFTKNKNMVISLADGIESLFLGGFEGTSIRNVPNAPYGQIFGYTWLRDDNNNIIIESDTSSANYGFPVASLKEEVIGNPNPKFLMGLRNSFSFKSFTLSFLLDLRYGGDIWNGTQGALTFFGMSKNTETRGETQVFEGVLGTVDADGQLITNGTTNNVAVTVDERWYLGDGGGFGNVAEHFIQDGSFLKLRDISLAYNIPKSVLAKTPIAEASISASARNFILWTPYQGIDPETNLMGSMNAQGLDYFNMPSTKSYMFSINLGF